MNGKAVPFDNLKKNMHANDQSVLNTNLKPCKRGQGLPRFNHMHWLTSFAEPHKPNAMKAASILEVRPIR